MINTTLVVVHTIIFEVEIIKIMGKIRAISTSKIKKMIVIRKNRSEKGNREDDFGSNPHSNGEHFSRSVRVFFDKIDANIITTLAIIIKIDVIIAIEKIIYTTN